MNTTHYNGIIIEEVELPKGSFNAKCTLESEWDSNEIMIDPQAIEEASDALKHILSKNLITHINEEHKK